MDWFDKLIEMLENWFDSFEAWAETRESCGKEMTADEAAQKVRKMQEKKKKEEWADICDHIAYGVENGEMHRRIRIEFEENLNKLKDLGYECTQGYGDSYLVEWGNGGNSDES